jgi:SAM-dependent methyltransferase
VRVEGFDARDAYAGAAGAWAAGPAAVYATMAETLVRDCPRPLEGARALDFGAGTGATSAAIGEAGAEMVAADLSLDMLCSARTTRPPAANADVLHLPFRDHVFDVAVGAFVLSHVPEPARALAEVARTVRAGGTVMTLGFDGRWSFPAKAIVEDVMRRFGLERPAWYTRFKDEIEPLTSVPDRLVAVAGAAGLVDVTVHEHAVDVGVRTADGIIAWRLGNPMYAPFMAALDPSTRDDVLDALRAAIGPDPAPLVPELLVLVAGVP